MAMACIGYKLFALHWCGGLLAAAQTPPAIQVVPINVAMVRALSSMGLFQSMGLQVKSDAAGFSVFRLRVLHIQVG